MTTAIEDIELNDELQELYLVNKQWLSDLEFMDTEFDFLRKLAITTLIAVLRNEELNSLVDIESIYAFLKKDILAYLHQLGPIIVTETKLLDADLIEGYSSLKRRLTEMFQECRKLKHEIFEVSKAKLAEVHNLTAAE